MKTFKEYLISPDEAIEENRRVPGGMNYQFDEIDPDVDKNSFRNSNKARRKSNRPDDYNREMGFRDEARRDARGPNAEERLEYQMMHGTEEEEAKVPANRDRDIEFQGNMRRLNKRTAADDNASTPGIKRLKQRYNRYKRKTWGEEEEQRMAPRGMDYKFDDRRPQKGADRHRSLPTGRSGRSDRVVNNSLRRPKQNIVKDKDLDPRVARANDAFKEGEVGNIFAAAFSMINEFGPSLDPPEYPNDDYLEKILSDPWSLQKVIGYGAEEVADYFLGVFEEGIENINQSEFDDLIGEIGQKYIDSGADGDY